ncbi:hypothetical protein, conserved [Eimeria acervulina]|uniref:Uncharacterized protein n=1 Tax=Eimeria acervulina TaxID=5801 RepID=U6GSI8_EIMAC|nr:hypothetical protein, conserved [Eimeria acervulina]CDI81539.1 hypothetical protein, conserved [Eimeria acervulina]
MSSGAGVMGPWPDLAPPPEAVHLFHRYEDLKAQLLPLESPPQPQTPEKVAPTNDALHAVEAFAREPSVAAAAALPRQGASGLLQPFSQTFSRSREAETSKCAPFARGSSPAASRKNGGSMCWADRSRGALGPCSPAAAPGVLSKETQGLDAVIGLLDTANSHMDEATAPPRYTQSSTLPTVTRFGSDVLTAQRRTRSSDSMGFPLVKGRNRRAEAVASCEQQADSSPCQGTLPPEIESLMMRLQHRSCNTGTAAPFSWRRARERARAVAAAARSSSSSSNCLATEGNWKFDGDMLVPGDAAKTKVLRQEALKRVRQRAREARERQQQQFLQQQVEQEQQQQRSQALCKQLRQRTLQRIREIALKQEEEKQQQELLQQQMLRQAEAQRQYCARHRKALQQRLLQQQQEIKDKIRMHAEESSMQ